MKIIEREKIAYLLREEKKKVEILVPSEEEKEEIKETLKKLFAENFLTYSAFIVNSMLGEERKTKPILSISDGYGIGKTITGYLIGKLSTDKFIKLPASDFRKTKALGAVLTNRIVIIDDIDIDGRGLKKTLNFLEEVNEPYFAYGLTTADTFFVCISIDDCFFADWKMKDAVIPTALNRNEFAKQNIEKLYKDREWVLKTRGFYFSFLPEVLKKMEEMQKMEIFKSCERYVKVAYALSKILGDENNEFDTINSEFEFGYK